MDPIVTITGFECRKEQKKQLCTYNGIDGYTLLLMERQEINDFESQQLFNWRVRQTKVNLYRKPSKAFNQKGFQHIPKPLKLKGEG